MRLFIHPRRKPRKSSAAGAPSSRCRCASHCVQQALERCAVARLDAVVIPVAPVGYQLHTGAVHLVDAAVSGGEDPTVKPAVALTSDEPGTRGVQRHHVCRRADCEPRVPRERARPALERAAAEAAQLEIDAAAALNLFEKILRGRK